MSDDIVTQVFFGRARSTKNWTRSMEKLYKGEVNKLSSDGSGNRR